MRLKARLLRIATLLLSYLPTALPENEPAHLAWSDSILELAGYPGNDSVRSAVASMVLHLDAGRTRASKQSFVAQIKRSIANQAAYNIMNDIKEKEKAARERQLKEASEAVVQETKEVRV